jgi:hypothetical protein
VVSAYSTGLDVKFLCAPVCSRQDSETTTTWTLFEEKGDVKLQCWAQNGVESTSHTIRLSKTTPGVCSLHPIDETGDSVIVSHGNSQLECYQNERKEAMWTWAAPERVAYLQTFKATDCPLTQNLDGYILLLVSDHARFYLLSSATRPEEAIQSFSLPVMPIFYPC